MTFTYTQLKEITEKNDSFYSSIQEIDGYLIESFSYRLVSWSVFQENPLYKEMRGIAYIYGNEIKTPQLFTIGYHKFFNYGEGEGQNSPIELLKIKKIENIVDKLDGSLIMFGQMPNGVVLAKSKMSIHSEQAIKATNIINADKGLYKFIKDLLRSNLFPIFEYVGPDNRIVVSYKSSKLILSGIRKSNGQYLSYDEIENKCLQYNISNVVERKTLTLEQIITKKSRDKGYEGFVINLQGGDKIKIKIDSYILLHHTKDEINNIKKLIKAAINEDLDDLRSLFADDKESIARINNVEKKVFDYIKTVRHNVEKEVQKTKHLIDRKQYAIYHQKNNLDIFGLLMQYRTKGTPDYKTYTLQQIKIKEEDLI